MRNKKYLPLGSIVILKGATKRIMISGYYVQSEGKYFDYCGCLYPEGFLSSDSCLLFNRNQIDKVFYLGFSDNESRIFFEKLDKIVNDDK